ncbi:transporter substrate-binding domain-containing protein [Paracoccus indicus]|uniref:transporter substrate-binding domain-containing protein n=1 Tax=Paracoccus indicus TaxID=2079229 RepID=UPI000D334BF7|nr:transporter substrate-binding domain-containing protein [Paracoccus indicus]
MKTLMIAAAAMALTAGLANAETIRMGTEGAYAPYNFIDDATGEVTGFEIELGNELCARAELECTWVRNDWDSIIPNLVSSNYDTIMAGMNINEERKQVIQFTQPYTPAMPSAYAALSADVDVEGGIIAAQTSTIQAGHVAETGATLLEYPNPDQTVAAVRNGEADAVFADRDFLAPIVEESGGELVWVDGKDAVPLGEGIGMGLRQSDTELKDKFDAVITEMKEDGSLNELIVKWFGDDALTFE